MNYSYKISSKCLVQTNDDILNRLSRMIFIDNDVSIFSVIRNSDIGKLKYNDGELLIDKIMDAYLSEFDNIDVSNNIENSSIIYYENLILELLECSYKNGRKINEINERLKCNKNIFRGESRLKFKLICEFIECVNMIISRDKDYTNYIDSMIRRYSINSSFSDEIMDCVNRNQYKNDAVRDLRGKRVITIDLHYKAAFDDAISIEKIGDNYLLGVYVADVASYIDYGSSLERESRNRGASIYTYPSNNVYIPLFPIDLTRDVFSLNRNSDKRVVAHMFLFSSNYDLINYSIFNGIINVNNNYDFGAIDRFSSDDENYDIVNMLSKLTDKLGDDFNSNTQDNVNYSLRKSSHIVSVVTRFLNSFVASLFNNSNLPYIYRVNDFNTDNMGILKSFYSTSALGYSKVNGGVYGHVSNPIRSYASYINQYLEQVFLISDIDEMTKQNLIEYWNRELESIIKPLNERLSYNDLFASKVKRIDDKKLTKRR